MKHRLIEWLIGWLIISFIGLNAGLKNISRIRQRPTLSREKSGRGLLGGTHDQPQICSSPSHYRLERKLGLNSQLACWRETLESRKFTLGRYKALTDQGAEAVHHPPPPQHPRPPREAHALLRNKANPPFSERVAWWISFCVNLRAFLWICNNKLNKVFRFSINSRN